MRYQQLGHSSLQISSIGFGCMSLADGQADNERLVHQAIDRGINFFDTADLYQGGLNEQSIGRMLKGKRDRVILATKVGNQMRGDGSGVDWNPRPEYILRAAEESLARLQIDCIDLYQLHGGTMEDPIDDTIGAFELLQQQGKIRHYGISSIRPNVIREYIRRSRIVSVMMQYSLLDRRPEESCLELLGKNGIGVLARGGLAKGLLVGKPPAAYLNYSAEQVAQAAQAVRSASGSGRSPSQTAVAFVLHSPFVSSAVTGMRTTGQMEEVLAPDDFPALSPEAIEILRESVPITYYEQFR
jgi:aryl-alcohol dehydrogenase-like predicted oxidoreductase